MMAGVTVGESISFDKVAAIYDATRGGLERGIRFAAAIEPYCGSGPVFEIGVGTGAIARPLRDRLGRPVLGADLSGEMLQHARTRLGATVVRSDVALAPGPRRRARHGARVLGAAPGGRRRARRSGRRAGCSGATVGSS